MTGTYGPDDRILRTTSSLDAAMARSASAPLAAVTTSNPANRSDPASSSRIVCSSSTTSSRAAPGPSPVMDLMTTRCVGNLFIASQLAGKEK
jgi:hypothetical protein